MEVCRKCGAPLKNNDKFCSRCGARVRRPSSRYTERQKRKEQKKVTFRTSPEKDTGYREHFEEKKKKKSALSPSSSFLPEAERREMISGFSPVRIIRRKERAASFCRRMRIRSVFHRMRTVRRTRQRT